MSRTLLNLCRSLALTIFIHPLPLWIYRLMKKEPIAPKKAKKIVFLDAILVFILYLAICVTFEGVTFSFYPLIIWSIISYKLITSGYREKKSEETTTTDDNFWKVPASIVPAETKVQDLHEPKDDSDGGIETTLQKSNTTEKEYYIVDKATGEVVGEKKKYDFGRKLLACVVPYAAFEIVSLLFNLTVRAALWLWRLAMGWSTFLFVLGVFMFGSTILWIALTPLIYGIHLTVELSEMAAPSPQGTRYAVFATFGVLYCIIIFAAGIILKSFQFASIYMFVFALMVGIKGINESKAKNS